MEPVAAPGPPADHVVLVALDGFDAGYLDLLDDLPTPHLDALVRRGSLTTGTGVMPSITNPSWTSIATGAWPDRHLNTAFWYDPATGTARGQQRDIAVPTIAEAVREQGGTVLSVQWSVVQDHGTAFGDADGLYTQPGGDCARRVDDAVAVLRGDPVRSGGRPVRMARLPRLLAVYCDTLDALGHAGGDRHPQIPAALRTIDTQVGRLVAATKDAGIAGRTAFVLLGDHGMTTFDRGFGRAARAAIRRAGYRAEIVRPGASPRRRTEVVIVVGGVASLHLVGHAADDPAATGTIRRALEALPQVRAVFGKEDQTRMRMSPRFGELVVEPEPGWSFGPTPRRPAGRHGATTELEVAFALAGAGVAPGRPPSGPRHVDVAPTVAALLGIDPPAGAQGRVLTEALAAPQGLSRP
ncbi:alkaline phosphatase family protein [Isoptericola croceus]|uniref:alkaline phosphatase family protein n=1 Tax=Isoptericola croceus TaxID=3031406 RepID=UPI0023F8742E|nr:alkaline phosphatase family protein [Isoptericola croceus]